MKFSIFTACLPEYNLEDSVKKVREFGYDGIEWRVNNVVTEKPADYDFNRRYWSFNQSTVDSQNLSESAAQAKAYCDQYGVALVGLSSYLNINSPAGQVQEVLRAASKIGCKMVRIMPPGYDSNTNYREQMDTARKNLAVLEGLAKQENVQIIIEMHMSNLTPSASSIFMLVNGFDPKYVGVIYDSGNMVYEGYEPFGMGLDILGEYLAHVHVKNAILTPKKRDEFGANVWSGDFAPFKEGSMYLPGLIKALKERNYTGFISVEDFSNECGTDEKLKDNLEFLKACMG